MAGLDIQEAAAMAALAEVDEGNFRAAVELDGFRRRVLICVYFRLFSL